MVGVQRVAEGRPGSGAGSGSDRPGGLLKQPTKTVLEAALNAEMPEHLGHEKHRAGLGRR